MQYKQFVGRGGWGQARNDQLATPAWLSQLAPEAKVVAFALEELNQFIAPQHEHDNLENIITKLTGKMMWLSTAQCVLQLASDLATAVRQAQLQRPHMGCKH